MKITETKRLFIDEASTDDAYFFFRLMNSPGWLTYIGNRNIKSETDAVTYITEKIIKSYADNGFGLYVMKLKENNEPNGICGFLKRDYLPHADIGFALSPDYENKGFMFEAAESVLQYGFSHLSFTEVLAIIYSTNTKSQWLLSKLGFIQTGEMESDQNQPPTLIFSVKRTD